MARVGATRFACTLEGSPGQVVLFDLVCTLRWPLSKANGAPRVEAMYRAKATQLIAIGSAIPACIARCAPNSVVVTCNTAARADVERKEGDGQLVSINLDNGEVKQLVTFRSTFGIAS